MASEALPGGKNIILNPSAETNLTDIPVNAGATVTRDQEHVWTGSYAVKVVANPSNNFSGVIYNADLTQVTVTGVAFSIAGRIRIWAAGGVVIPYISMRFNYSDASYNEDLIPLSTFSGNGNWQTFTFHLTNNPAKTITAIRFYLGNWTTPGALTFWVDGADIRVADDIDTYIDGDQGPEYGWTGTPHGSASYRNAIEVRKASGRRGSIKITPRLMIADKLNNMITDLSSYILTGNVEMRTSREVKMAFRGTVQDPEIIFPYTDYLAPFMRLEYSNGDVIDEQLGLYSLAPMASTTYERFQTGEFAAQDLCWNLQQTAFSGQYSVPAGTNYVTRIRAILEGEGFTRHAIPSSSKTLPKSITWDAKASKLQIINDLLNAIGYYTLFVDRQGVFRSFPYNDLDTVQPALRLFSGEGSTVVGAVKREPTITGIVNFVKLTREDTSNPANSLYWEDKNDSAVSKVSTVNLGRTIFYELSDSKFESLDVMKAFAKKTLQDAASLYTKYTIQTLPDPQRSCFEVYDTDIFMKSGKEVLSGKVRVDGWDIGFTPSSALMTHYANRLEAYTNG